jgi:hypothetical protein
MMEAASTSEKSVNFYQITRRYKPEDRFKVQKFFDTLFNKILRSDNAFNAANWKRNLYETFSFKCFGLINKFLLEILFYVSIVLLWFISYSTSFFIIKRRQFTCFRATTAAASSRRTPCCYRTRIFCWLSSARQCGFEDGSFQTARFWVGCAMSFPSLGNELVHFSPYHSSYLTNSEE